MTLQPRTVARLGALPALCLGAGPAWAAGGALDGAALGAAWSLPFVGVLLSIALGPLLAPGFWHHHFGKVALAWALAFLVPFAAVQGVGAAAHLTVHAALVEYVPFIVLLTALFTVAGGILVRGNFRGGAAFNCALMALGAVLASLMGTTGASMLLVRPLIRANDHRRHNAHVFVFFIFIVSNAGGALTPLGDPPLFLGFLKGIDFFWTLQHLWLQTAFVCGGLLVLLYLLDSWYDRREGRKAADPTPENAVPFAVEGGVNLVLLGAAVALVLLSGVWQPAGAVEVFGTPVGLAQAVRDGGLLLVTVASLVLTPRSVREANQFDWAPMLEVGKLFAAIFLTIVPVLAMLQAGEQGAFAPIVRLVTDGNGQPIPGTYFWATGLLSAFLDNAPTYLVFFNLASGDPQVLMTTLAPVLAAVSAGAVFMGAGSYIGNAPNLMVKSIAESQGVRMPSFFGYMAWSACILLPLLFGVTWIGFQ